MKAGDDLLRQMLEPMLRDHCVPHRLEEHEGRLDEELWAAVTGAGLTTIAIDEGLGGSGGELEDAAFVVKAAAREAAQIPLADHCIVAGWARSLLGLPVANEPETVILTRESLAHRMTVRNVPWAAVCRSFLIVEPASDGSALVHQATSDELDVAPHPSLAGEPHGTVTIDPSSLQDGTPVAMGFVAELKQRRALVRALMIAGALETILELSLTYARERHQFGRAIGSFQAVRQQLAILAGEVATASVAASSATQAVSIGRGGWAAAAARIRCSAAATTAAQIAHQIHGAIGFTREHRLHLFTRRVWAWRDELGTQRDWQLDLGRAVFAQRKDFWTGVVG